MTVAGNIGLTFTCTSGGGNFCLTCITDENIHNNP